MDMWTELVKMIAEALPAAVVEGSGPSISLDSVLGLMTGGSGAILALYLWTRNLIADKKEMADRHREKDERLTAITRDAVACIQASVSSHAEDQAWRERVDNILTRLDKALENAGS